MIVSSSDRQVLEAIVADRNRPRKRVERAEVVLAAAERGLGVADGRMAGGQPPDGLALAAGVGRGRRRRAAAGQDAQARRGD